MCSNYKPVTLQDRLLANFGVVRPDTADPPELTLPGYLSPFIVRAEHREKLEGEALVGVYGLLPAWAESLAFGKNTYNCRTETMKTKSAFREAWRSEHRCVIPVEWLYEFCYETGDPVRWAVKLKTGGPMGVAGLWGIWYDRDGVRVPSFTMLTVNADGHGIFGKLHPPKDEKRMPVILDPQEYDTWLNAPIEVAEKLIRAYPAEKLESFPDPAPWKKLPEPKAWAAEPDMFADEWRRAAEDPESRQIKARRGRQKPKKDKPAEDGPMTGDLF